MDVPDFCQRPGRDTDKDTPSTATFHNLTNPNISCSDPKSDEKSKIDYLHGANTRKRQEHLVRPGTAPILSDRSSNTCCSNETTIFMPVDTFSAQSSTVHSYTPNTNDTEHTRGHKPLKRNTFDKLAQFFAHPDQVVIVVDLLRDHLARGIVSPCAMVTDLWEYCEKHIKRTDQRAHLFIHSVFVSLSSCANTNNQITRVVELMCRPQFFDVYLTMFGHPAHSQPARRPLLEIYLKQGNRGRIMCDAHTKFIDMKLGFGETPLTSALRHRDVEMVDLLLKYGARTQTRWLAFHEAIEVLLFSPNHIILSEVDLENIRLCLPLVIAATPYIRWRHIDALLKDGYCALYPNWSEHIKSSIELDCPPSLKHMSRTVIRQSMHWNLLDGIEHLHIPRLMKAYLNLCSPLFY